MIFRIGINLGDIIEDEGGLYGDGVNVAARLESLAETGGISISGTVYDHVKNKLPFRYEYLGEQSVKNIPEPVRVYRVIMEPEEAEKRIIPKRPGMSPLRWSAVIAGIVLVVAVGALIVRNFFYRTAPQESVSMEKMAFKMPDKPSIAVLPFVNMSDDPEQEYFCDGITEDLITDLSKISGLFVIARNSTFVYKDKPVKIRQVAEELGVRYVLEGSVRRSRGRIRVNAQLIDATTGHHLWAERYDGQLTDIFALQDNLTRQIIAALTVRLTSNEQKQLSRQDTDNIDAYDNFLQGWNHYRKNTPDDWAKAISFFEKSIKLDPDYGQAYAANALIFWKSTRTADAAMGTNLAVGGNFYEATLQARENLQLAIKKPSSISYQVGALMYLYRRQYEKAITEAERSITLDDNNTDNLYTLAYILIAAGRTQTAVENINRGMRHDPHNIAQPLYLLGMIHFARGQFEDAVNLIERALKHNPRLPRYAPILAAAYAHLGHDPKARAALDDYKKVFMNIFTITTVINWYFPFKEPKVVDRLANGLLKAGLPPSHSGYYNYFQENGLTGEEIRVLVSGRKIMGFKRLGIEYWIERTSEGRAVYRIAPGTRQDFDDHGTSWIEDDMLCDQWEMHRFGQKECMAVFRNPKWSPKKKNQYLGISDYEIYPFSPVD
jgi:TolB-like protein/Flp pilus assembly protein TadD